MKIILYILFAFISIEFVDAQQIKTIEKYTTRHNFNIDSFDVNGRLVKCEKSYYRNRRKTTFYFYNQKGWLLKDSTVRFDEDEVSSQTNYYPTNDSSLAKYLKEKNIIATPVYNQNLHLIRIVALAKADTLSKFPYGSVMNNALIFDSNRHKGLLSAIKTIPYSYNFNNHFNAIEAGYGLDTTSLIFVRYRYDENTYLKSVKYSNLAREIDSVPNDSIQYCWRDNSLVKEIQTPSKKYYIIRYPKWTWFVLRRLKEYPTERKIGDDWIDYEYNENGYLIQSKSYFYNWKGRFRKGRKSKYKYTYYNK